MLLVVVHHSECPPAFFLSMKKWAATLSDTQPLQLSAKAAEGGGADPNANAAQGHLPS